MSRGQSTSVAQVGVRVPVFNVNNLAIARAVYVFGEYLVIETRLRQDPDFVGHQAADINFYHVRCQGLGFGSDHLAARPTFVMVVAGAAAFQAVACVGHNVKSSPQREEEQDLLACAEKRTDHRVGDESQQDDRNKEGSSPGNGSLRFRKEGALAELADDAQADQQDQDEGCKAQVIIQDRPVDDPVCQQVEEGVSNDGEDAVEFDGGWFPPDEDGQWGDDHGPQDDWSDTCPGHGSLPIWVVYAKANYTRFGFSFRLEPGSRYRPKTVSSNF